MFSVQGAPGGATSPVTISGVTITGGSANPVSGNAGGDVLNSGTLTLADDWITNGFACEGGGVGNANGGTMTLERTLVSANAAACQGQADASGGIANVGQPGLPDLPAHLVLENSTVTGNHARLAAGIYSSNDANNTVAITNSTIAGNVTDAEGGGAPSGPGAGLGIATGSVDIENSIVAGNVATASGVTVATNCAGSPGAVVSLGHNIESGSDCAFGSAGDLQNTDPLLGPLGAHGGPTETLAPGAGSKAINGGVPAGCTDLGGTAIVTDQRGISRPQGSACDIGAFEFRLPSMSGSPAVSGAGKVGQTLTCALPAVVSPDGAAQSTVTWLRDGTAVATGSTYGARTADARHTLSCSVSVSDAAGAVSATSAGVAITAAPPPTRPSTRPTVKLTGHHITKKRATFTFTVTHATSVQCAVSRHRKFGRFKPCKSPQIYHHPNGIDGFKVRVTGPGGTASAGFAARRGGAKRG